MMNKQEVMYWLNQIKDDIRGGDDDFDSKRKEALTYAIEYIGGALANKPQAIRKCNKCGYFIYCYEENGKLKFSNFCPNCGAEIQVKDELRRAKTTIRDICDLVVCDLIITFDEDPHRGLPDIRIPVSAEPKDILADRVLDLEINLMTAKDDSLWVSTNIR